MVSPSLSSSLAAFKNNELLINYHDAVIYGSDLKLIERRTEWLNDSCIHFFFTHLQQQQHKSCTTPSTTHRNFLFMEPSVVSFWMHQCMDQDEIYDFVNNTHFPGCKGNNKRDGTIFIAVNDSMSTTSSSSNNNDWQVPGSGNHWSLLVAEVVVSEERCEKDTKDVSSTRNNLRFWHFDSIRNSGNIQAAEDIAAKICLHVYPKASLMTKSVHRAETPQQQNGYDCGVHVLGAAKILSKYYASMTTLSTSDKGGFTGTSESPCRRLQDLEECLRNEIGNDSQDFCSKLRHKISFEIRRLHKERNK
jgi:sentrin-specific protease 8